MKRTALITGASSGIGAELAKLFAQDGYDLILVARRKEKLDALAKQMTHAHDVHAHVIVSDLANPESPQRLFDMVKEKGLAVDVLVNNAGFGGYGAFAGSDLQHELDMIQVNITALTHLTKLFLPGMIERKTGHVLNVASTAAFQSGPFMAVYFATKAYVLSFSEAIESELKGTGVGVTTLCPGATKTEFDQSANVTDTNLFSGKTMTAARVAEIAYGKMNRGGGLIVSGWKNFLLTSLNRLGPRKLCTAIARRIVEKK